MKPVVLFGAGKIAEVVYTCLTYDLAREVAAFTVDQAYLEREAFLGRPLVPFQQAEYLYPPDQYDMFVAIGYQNLNQARAEKYHQAKAKGYALINCISPRASNTAYIGLGDNCLVMDFCAIQPGCRLGSNVLVWSGVQIGHHSVIADHCYLASQALILSGAEIGEYTFIGGHATVGHHVSLGERNLIGAGTLITKKTAPGSVYIEPDTAKYRLDSESFLKLTRL